MSNIAAIQQRIQSTICSNKVIGNYEIVRKIGSGSFSTVYLAVHTMTRHEVVLKSSDKFQSNLAAEIANMSLLSHPHIVRLYEYIVMSDKVWLVLEYCGGQELYTYLASVKVIPPAQATRLFAQLAGAVAYAHQFNCAHRDLKLENVLLDDEGNIKLGDFGFTRSYVPRTMLETVCGTENYMAPELILRQKYNPEAVDVWSLGVILYAMIYGRLPFDEDSSAETIKRIVEDNPVFPPVPKGEHLVDIVRKLLCKNPNERPRVNIMLSYLKEPGKQQSQLLTRIINNPEASYIFSSNEERTVLKGLKALKIDLHMVASSIVHHKCDALHGLWFTALDRHRSVAKQLLESVSPNLSRRKSKASILSSRSQMRHLRSDISKRDSQRLDMGTQNQDKHSSIDLIYCHEKHPQSSFYSLAESEVEGHRNSQTNASFQSQVSHISLALKFKQSASKFTKLPSCKGVTSPHEGNQFDSESVQQKDNISLESKQQTNSSLSHKRKFTGRTKRAMDRLISALKIKRSTKKDNLLAYYDPQSINTAISTLDSMTFNSPVEYQEGHGNMDLEAQDLTSPLGFSQQTPTANLAKTIAVPTTENSFIYSPDNNSIEKFSNDVTSDLVDLRTRTNQNDSNSGLNSTPNDNNPLLPFKNSVVSIKLEAENPINQLSQLSQLPLSDSTQSLSSSLGTPNRVGASGNAGYSLNNPNSISRPMSSYSQISQISQLSQSSVDASALLAEIKETKSTTPTASSKKSRSGTVIEKKYSGIFPSASSTGTPPTTPILSRPRTRLVNVKQSIPRKIDEGDE